jgi:hypothetical protein
MEMCVRRVPAELGLNLVVVSKGNIFVTALIVSCSLTMRYLIEP